MATTPRRAAPARPARRPVVVAVVVATAFSLLVLFGAAGCGSGGSSPSGAASRPGDTTAASTKVTVAGDSISVGFGASLRTALGGDTGGTGDTGEVVTKVIGVEGTGLAHPERFDWPARLTELARDFPPTVLVLSLGSNDAQDLTDAQGKIVVPQYQEDAWDAEYSRRLAAAVDPFASTGTTVVWLGHVRTAEDRVGLVNRHIHQLAVQVAASRPFVQVADLAALLGTGEQRASRCLIPDGLHLSVGCLDEAAEKLVPQLPLP